MSERKISSLYRWLLLSLLAHLAIAALLLLQQPKAPVKQLTAAPITVFAVSKPKPPAPAEPVKAEPVKAEKLQPTAPMQNKPTAAVALKTTETIRQRKPANRPEVTAAPALKVTTPESPAAPADFSTLLDSVAARTAQRELSAAELAALTTPKAEVSVKPATTIRRPAVKPGTGPAADVLETLPDGSQLVKVGQGCVLATPGADLRKDIHSMKVVGCGAGGRTGQDRIDAHFEQVMSQVGQHR